jgi:hypothetical protein
MAELGAELQNGVLGAGQADPARDTDLLREDEPGLEARPPAGDDAELGDRG